MTPFESSPAAAEARRVLRCVFHPEMQLDHDCLLKVLLKTFRDIPFNGDHAETRNGVDNGVPLSSKTEKLPHQGVVHQGLAQVVATDTLIVKIVGRSVVRQKETAAHVWTIGRRNIHPWSTSRRFIDRVVLCFDENARPFPDGPSELNSPALDVYLASYAGKTVVRFTIGLRSDPKENRPSSWVQSLTQFHDLLGHKLGCPDCCHRLYRGRYHTQRRNRSTRLSRADSGETHTIRDASNGGEDALGAVFERAPRVAPKIVALAALLRQSSR